MEHRENVLFDSIDGITRIDEEQSFKDVASLRGFLDYADTISDSDDKPSPQSLVQTEAPASAATKFTNTNLTNLMEKETVTKPTHRCTASLQTHDTFDDRKNKTNFKPNEKNQEPYRCAICQGQFDSRVFLDRHIVDLHLGTMGRFQCDICQKEFSRISDLARHKLIHSGIKPFQCNTCQKQFSRQDHLKQHILSHSQCSDSEFFSFDNSLNRCTICHKQLSRPQHLRTHMRQHLGTLFECDKCSKRFSRASHLRAHMRLHLGTCYRCDVCQKEFSRPSDLERHKLTHLDKKLFECPTCRKKFSRKDNLKKHMLCHVESNPVNQDSHHRIDFTKLREDDSCTNSNNCECGVCVVKSSSPLDLEGHAKIHSDVKGYGCLMCSKQFTRKHQLKRHLISHKTCCNKQITEFVECREHDSDTIGSGVSSNTCGTCNTQFGNIFKFGTNMCAHWTEKKFQCTICEKRFNRKVRLKEHIRLHSEAKFTFNNIDKDQNRCSICQKQLSRPEHLKAHMRLHLGTLFKCEICQKEFSRLSDLDRHKLVHSGLKQFICIICHKQFSRKDYLKNHMLSHANQKSFECDKCKKRFTYFTNLRNHLHHHLTE